MKNNFWQELKKPIFVLAPMANVTDAAFRFIIAKYGKPDVMWTEFVSADGLCSKGKDRLLPDLWFDESERPIVAQIFSADPEKIATASKLVKKLGFDGLDINMGCPDKGVEKQGAGAALIKNPALAQKIILAAKKNAHPLPVSVKTRIGYNQDSLNDWLPALLESEPAVITIHARTRKEMSKVPARWDTVSIAVKIRDQISSSKKTLIFGNGDIKNLKEAKLKTKETGADGIMIGRGIFGNPWLFNSKINIGKIKPENKLKVLIEHTYRFENQLSKLKRFEIMKKHFKAYVNGWDGAKELRMELMKAENATDVQNIIQSSFPKLKLK
jgi:nifR3 family TIM-barrel protein